VLLQWTVKRSPLRTAYQLPWPSLGVKFGQPTTANTIHVLTTVQRHVDNKCVCSAICNCQHYSFVSSMWIRSLVKLTLSIRTTSLSDANYIKDCYYQKTSIVCDNIIERILIPLYPLYHVAWLLHVLNNYLLTYLLTYLMWHMQRCAHLRKSSFTSVLIHSVSIL